MNERDGNTQDRRAGRDVVLVVDDEAINQMVLTAVLDPDYRVLSAISGLEALEMARKLMTGEVYIPAGLWSGR